MENTIAILGGTGPAGEGLAYRLADAGYPVIIGSRDAKRAENTAEMIKNNSSKDLKISGRDNEEACEANVVILSFSHEAALGAVNRLRAHLKEKTVVSMVNSLEVLGKRPVSYVTSRGSIAGEIQAILRESKVVGAFHHLDAGNLNEKAGTLEGDVLVFSDFVNEKNEVMKIVDSIKYLRAIDAGDLSSAGAIEAFTSVLVGINIKYKVHSQIKLLGL
jgi:NADPH-dependent F420 reductase